MTPHISEFDWTEDHREAYFMDFDVQEHLIIIVDGRDVGAMSLRRTEGEIYFANLHILTEFQGKGLGTKIFRDVFAEADAMGIPVVGQAFRSNPVRRLHERLGFIVISETDLRYKIIRPVPRGTGRFPEGAADAE
jgi:GNAT superfamily N-acetyltransferase